MVVVGFLLVSAVFLAYGKQLEVRFTDHFTTEGRMRRAAWENYQAWAKQNQYLEFLRWACNSNYMAAAQAKTSGNSVAYSIDLSNGMQCAYLLAHSK